MGGLLLPKAADGNVPFSKMSSGGPQAAEGSCGGDAPGVPKPAGFSKSAQFLGGFLSDGKGAGKGCFPGPVDMLGKAAAFGKVPEVGFLAGKGLGKGPAGLGPFGGQAAMGMMGKSGMAASPPAKAMGMMGKAGAFTAQPPPDAAQSSTLPSPAELLKRGQELLQQGMGSMPGMPGMAGMGGMPSMPGMGGGACVPGMGGGACAGMSGMGGGAPNAADVLKQGEELLRKTREMQQGCGFGMPGAGGVPGAGFLSAGLAKGQGGPPMSAANGAPGKGGGKGMPW